MARIVSLLPGATEIICALGLEADLVGRSHECDFPASVERLPSVSKPRLNPNAAGREIDQSVKALVSQGLGVFEVDAARLQALKPDIIVTQIHCEVCAVSEDVVQADPEVIIVSPCGFTLERAAEEAQQLRTLAGWAELTAVRRGRVYAFEGHHYLHRPGPRLVESAEFLARVIKGEQRAAHGHAYQLLSRTDR